MQPQFWQYINLHICIIQYITFNRNISFGNNFEAFENPLCHHDFLFQFHYLFVFKVSIIHYYGNSYHHFKAPLQKKKWLDIIELLCQKPHCSTDFTRVKECCYSTFDRHLHRFTELKWRRHFLKFCIDLTCFLQEILV